MAGLHGEQLVVINYDTSPATGYDFVDPVRTALDISDSGLALSAIHTLSGPTEIVTKETDSTTDLHSQYYDNIGNTTFYEEYERFIGEVIAPTVGAPIYAQLIPSIRFHLPGNKAVGDYHTDSDHGYGHQKAAINFWVPLTPAYGTNALHIQLGKDEEAIPIKVNPGHVLAFDAVNLLHGNEINKTGQTRVSFDFRVVEKDKYEHADELSANTNTPLTVGNYYYDPDSQQPKG